jgi:deoxycytidine triphosphate deaminase
LKRHKYLGTIILAGDTMIIAPKKLFELNEKYNLIENLSEREANPEGVGIDVRAGEVYRLKGDSFLGVTERKTPEMELIADIKKGDKEIILEPNEMVLVKTMEKVNLPGEKIIVNENEPPMLIMQDVRPRSTLQRCGIYFMGTKTDPGYSGELTYALKNVSNHRFKLELGARFANIIFYTVLGDVFRSYDGQWKGGRVTTAKKETQN